MESEVRVGNRWVQPLKKRKITMRFFAGLSCNSRSGFVSFFLWSSESFSGHFQVMEV